MSDLYFAYGSNLKPARMQERVPSASPLVVARLQRWRFTIDKRGKDGSGKANLASDPGAHVWGLVYRIDTGLWNHLDAFEPGYTRNDVEVATADGRKLAAQTYIASARCADLVAFDWYKALIVEGAQEQGLPAEYVADLETLAATPDPNAST